jgi:GWxTD domain-containing protein
MRQSAVHIASSVLLIAVAVFAMKACKTTAPISQRDERNVAYLYNPRANPINPLYRIVNKPGSGTILSVKVFTDEFLFSEANPTGELLASVSVQVTLINDTQGGVVTDTAFTDISINRDEGYAEYVINIPLNTFDGSEYTANVKVTDNLVRRRVHTFLKFHRLSETSQFNYHLVSATYRSEPFLPLAGSNESFLLRYNQPQPDTLYIHYYGYFDLIPYSPSMMLPERRISNQPEEILAVPWSDNNPLLFPERGIYLLSPDSMGGDGFPVFNFGDEFPETSSPNVLIETLAYIATPAEIRSMTAHDNAKIAVDEFWLARSNNIERSRELLRIYYNRVRFANHYFTSFKEGWRSDRGMIYIMYGPARQTI